MTATKDVDGVRHAETASISRMRVTPGPDGGECFACVPLATKSPFSKYVSQSNRLQPAHESQASGN
jgi:hypothetical protein